jgi:inner membrane protein
MPIPLPRLRSSVTLKLIFIGLLVLGLLIPIGMIEMLIHSRQSTAEEARQDIMQSFGRPQAIAGPLLVLPYRYPVKTKDEKTEWHRGKLFVSPERLDVSGSVAPEIRYRGLHRLPVYTASLDFAGTFGPLDPAEHMPLAAVPLWGAASLAVSVSDPRPIKARMVLALGETESEFEPGGVLVQGLPGFLLAPLPDLAADRPLPDLRFHLTLAGSDRLSFLPVGDRTRVELASTWSSPSFTGAYLPDGRTVDESGFTARWTVLALGRGFPSVWRHPAVQKAQLDAATFGVRLYEPVSVYQQAIRAVKYAVLFVAFTFVVYFLMEIFAARALHPFQYLLVGFANCLFYLLLISVSEHLSFTLSYLLSATACAVLVAGYSISVLASMARAAVVLVVMAALYSFLFVVLRSEDHALLMGALALFVALAAVMYLTRRIDWYAVSLERPIGAPAGPA